MLTRVLLINELPFLFALTFTPTDLPTLVWMTCLGLVNVIGAIVAARIAMRPIAVKVTAMEPVLSRVDTHVNGEKSRMEAENALLRSTIAIKDETIVELKTAREMLAQAKATTDAIQAVAAAAVAGATTPGAPAVSTPASPVLASIDANTKDTANNTARTDKKVDDLTGKP